MTNLEAMTRHGKKTVFNKHYLL